MQQNKRKISLKRFIMSYVCVFLIPTLLIIMCVQLFFVRSLTEAQSISLNNAAETIKNSIDKEFDKFYEITNHIQLTRESEKTYKPERDYIKIMNLTETLSMFHITSSIVDDISVYCIGDNYVFSNKSSCVLRHYAMVYGIENVSSESELRSIFKNTSKVSYLGGNKGGEEFRVHLYPIVYVNNNTEKLVMFKVKNSAYNSYLQNSLNDNIGMAFISDSAGNIISYVSNDSTLSRDDSEIVLSDISKTSSSSGNVHINDKKYIYASLTSDVSDYRFTVAVGDGAIMKRISDLYMMWSIIIVSSIILGLGAAFLFSEFNYKPIKELKSKAKSVAELGDSVDDYNLLYNAFDYINTKNEVLQSNIDELNEYIVFKLFKGNINNIEESNQLGKILGTSIYGTSFRVIIVRGDLHKLRSHINSHLPDKVNYLMRINEKDQCAEIALVFKANSEALTRDLAEKIAADGYSVSVGRMYSDIHDVPISLMEATQFLPKQGEVLYYENKTGKEFKEALADKRVSEYMSKIIEGIETESISINEAKLIYLRCAHELANYCVEKDMEAPELLDTFQLIKTESRDMIIEKLRELENSSAKDEISKNVLSQMTTYIKTHYRDIGFSVQHMANEFGITLPAMNAFFKENTGNNVNEYISDMKMTIAKDLLENSDLPVYDIGMELGYYGKNSFIRRFKQLTGITPGEYRAAYRGQEEEDE